jgi:hypothetical protein
MNAKVPGSEAITFLAGRHAHAGRGGGGEIIETLPVVIDEVGLKRLQARGKTPDDVRFARRKDGGTNAPYVMVKAKDTNGKDRDYPMPLVHIVLGLPPLSGAGYTQPNGNKFDLRQENCKIRGGHPASYYKEGRMQPKKRREPRPTQPARPRGRHVPADTDGPMYRVQKRMVEMWVLEESNTGDVGDWDVVESSPDRSTIVEALMDRETS